MVTIDYTILGMLSWKPTPENLSQKHPQFCTVGAFMLYKETLYEKLM